MHEVETFLNAPGPLYDIRSPGEYHQGTLPGAINLPLFTDEERHAVGTAYKKDSPKAAFLLGLEFAGPKMRGFVESVPHETPRLFCFRGGMRSQSMGWLFSQSGMKPLILKGGYKAFRKFVLKTLEKPYPFQILGGLTGVGKTTHLRSLNAQFLDLEALARHKGSAFGKMEEEMQPSNEHFENCIAASLLKMDLSHPIWIEDESRMIGSCKIPDPLFKQMLNSPLYLLQTPLEERIDKLVDEYGKYPENKLKEAVICIKNRLGGEKTSMILQCIEDKNFKKAVFCLLEYYDRAYMFSIKRSQRTPIIYETVHRKTS